MSKAAQLAALIGSGQAQGDKNLIINGAMQVAQRGTSTSSASAAAYHAVDRFDQNIVTMGAYTISQSTTAPTDFTTSLKMDVTTADASPASGDVVAIRTKLEGLNLQQLNFGTSNAKSITVSFYVKSNKTGTYVVSSYLADAGKQWGQTYTIDSANTWERKTITWQGSSNSSVINNDSGAGLIFTWYLGAGTGRTSGTAQTDWTAYATTGEAVGQTVNIADSTANEFFITGVQLEVGDVATPFEHESYAATLQKCQRYYTISGFNGGTPYGGGGIAMYAFSVSEAGGTVTFPTTMRAGPTIRTKDASGNIGGIHRAAVANVTSGVSVQWAGNAESDKVGFSGLTKSNAWAAGNMLIGVWDATAEL